MEDETKGDKTISLSTPSVKGALRETKKSRRREKKEEGKIKLKTLGRVVRRLFYLRYIKQSMGFRTRPFRRVKGGGKGGLRRTEKQQVNACSLY